MYKNVDHLLAQAQACLQQGNTHLAETILAEALSIKPSNPQTLYLLGLLKASKQEYTEAIRLLQKVIRTYPNEPSLHYNLAKALSDAGKDTESIPHHHKATLLAKDNPNAWLNYGKSNTKLGRHAEALKCYETAIRIAPNYLEAWSNKAVTLLQLKQHEQALASFNTALQINPHDPEVLCNKGLVLYQQNQIEESIDCYDRALEIHPNYAECWANKALSLMFFSMHEAALDCCEKALKIKSKLHSAWFYKGAACSYLKRHKEAILAYQQAFEIDAEFPNLAASLLHQQLIACQWNELPHLTKLLKENTKQPSHPFLTLLTNEIQESHLKVATQWANMQLPQVKELHTFPIRKSEKIRIGYFSPDFRDHPVSHLTRELFELHNREQFEIYAFSIGPDTQDSKRKQMEGMFDSFVDLREKSNHAAVDLVRTLNIDIAVDLGGWTEHTRPQIFAERIAPIQVNYLGYPGTMAMTCMDYIVVDKIVVPESAKNCFTEKIVHLPNSYMPHDSRRVISKETLSKTEHGLPEQSFVYCCFNNSHKITPVVFDAWCNILKKVEGSVLWISENNPDMKENLRIEAEKRGVDPIRLIFAPRLPLMADHLARHRLADVFLDTFPYYNAHTTACDALWAGLPVITLMGKSFPSRVAASLLTAIDLPELITHSVAEYEAQAIELATNKDKLAALKERLAKHRLNKPLFDTALFTKHIEDAYLLMYKRWQDGLKPEHIHVQQRLGSCHLPT